MWNAAMGPWGSRCPPVAALAMMLKRCCRLEAVRSMSDLMAPLAERWLSFVDSLLDSPACAVHDRQALHT